MGNTHLNRKCELLEELDLDFSAEEISEEKHPKLALIRTNYSRENLPLSPTHAVNEGSELTGESREELNYDSQSGAHSSLVTYFKTINRFALLNEEEERVLAKRIKESEEECKNLIIKWELLFKKEVLRRLSAKRIKEISERSKLLNGTLNLFGNLIKLERERKQVNLALKKLAHKSKIRRELLEELYKVEAEISKCIAEISLSKTIINRIMRNLKNLFNSKIDAKKQRMVEKELRKTLMQIGHISKGIKTLKNELIQANLRLVISIARKYSHRGIALPDLIQEGNLGLIRAIDTYDYRRGNRFITYATWWIRQAMIRALDCQSRTIRTPVYIKEKFHQIIKASNRLLQECEREPTLEEIAKKTNNSPESVEHVIKSFKDTVSIDAFVKEKGECTINPFLDHETVSPLEQVISSDLSQIMEVVLSELTPREREITKLRFGIGEKHDHTLKEIGREFNLSRERIRQVLKVTLNKLRDSIYIMKLKDFIELN